MNRFDIYETAKPIAQAMQKPKTDEYKKRIANGTKPDEERVHPIFSQLIKTIRGDYHDRAYQ